MPHALSFIGRLATDVGFDAVELAIISSSPLVSSVGVPAWTS